jgi:hypothetical protein
METSASFEARSAPSSYPTTVFGILIKTFIEMHSISPAVRITDTAGYYGPGESYFKWTVH